MERVKIGLLAVIAAAAMVHVGRGWVPEARGADGAGAVVCESFEVDPYTPGRGDERHLRLKAQIDPIRTWLDAHPGVPVFRFEHPYDPSSIAVVVCVR